MLKASTGRDRAAIRRHHGGPGGGESPGTIAIAMGADLAMLATKAAAAALTGSAALFAETLHSLADTGNQLLLLTGLRRAGRRPDARHPFGYGAELFYWSRSASSWSAGCCRSGNACSACSTPARCRRACWVLP
jgi:hypothetical protein